jgi:hypothetical protein
LVLLLIFGLAGCQGSDSPRQSSADVDPQADQVLKSMSNLLGKTKSFSFRAVGYMDEVAETGQLVQISRESDVSVTRPGKLLVETEGDDVSRSAWYSKGRLTVLDNTDNVYVSTDVPNTIEAMLDFIIDEYGLTLPLADLLFSNPYKTLTSNVQLGSYIGLGQVGDHSCHHLLFEQEMIDWQIWIDAGQSPVPRKFVITYKQEPGQPGYSVTMEKWDFNPTFANDLFEPDPPDDATEVQMNELLGTGEGE